MKLQVTAFMLFIGLCASAQNKMKPISDLINTDNGGWNFVQTLAKKAKNQVVILPVMDTAQSKEALYHTQVTTYSPMGAIVYQSGGILVDHGWIRILGSGCAKLNRSLPEWNKGKTITHYGDYPSCFLIADDAVGGFFFLNGGALGSDFNKVYYFAPDNLTFESLNLSYSDFLDFCFNGDLAKFYKNVRWPKWKTDIATLSNDKAFTFMPYLWTKEGADVSKDTRNIAQVEEVYQFNVAMHNKIYIQKD